MGSAGLTTLLRRIDAVHAHGSRTMLSHQNLAVVTVAFLFSVVALRGFVVSGAQSSEKEEREVLDKIPKHLPIKVKVRKPERLKDAQNEDWLGELEVEVTNTGTKPIYYLRIHLALQGVEEDRRLRQQLPLSREGGRREGREGGPLGVGRVPHLGTVGASRVVKGEGARRHMKSAGRLRL
jgi:hypothetical protein